MKGFIYKITNQVNGKVYIGQTHFTVEHRFKQHIKNYNVEHRKQILYKAFDKYGLKNFTVETVEEVECERLDEREMYWIAYYDSFKNGYNATMSGKGNIITWTDSQYEEIKNLYLSGFTSKKIADFYNVSSYTIIGILKSLNVKMRRNPLKMNAYEKAIFIKSYEEGETLNSLATKYHTDNMAVRRFLIKNNVKVRNKSILMERKDLWPSLISDFTGGMRYKDIEQKYHGDARTIKKILVMNGVDLRANRGLKKTTKNSFCLSEEQCEEVMKLYYEGQLVKNIASSFSVSIDTIYNALRKHHVKFNRYNHSKSVQSLKA